jgi:hypothetical protein
MLVERCQQHACLVQDSAGQACLIRLTACTQPSLPLTTSSLPGQTPQQLPRCCHVSLLDSACWDKRLQ